MNVQFAVKNNEVYLIEVNPRAARTVPFVSKATGVPLAKVAARVMAGKSLAEQGVTKWNCGAIILHGPHHGAQKSTSSGRSLRSTWRENVAVVNSMGSPVNKGRSGLSGVRNRARELATRAKSAGRLATNAATANRDYCRY